MATLEKTIIGVSIVRKHIYFWYIWYTGSMLLRLYNMRNDIKKQVHFVLPCGILHFKCQNKAKQVTSWLIEIEVGKIILLP